MSPTPAPRELGEPGDMSGLKGSGAELASAPANLGKLATSSPLSHMEASRSLSDRDFTSEGQKVLNIRSMNPGFFCLLASGSASRSRSALVATTADPDIVVSVSALTSG